MLEHVRWELRTGYRRPNRSESSPRAQLVAVLLLLVLPGTCAAGTAHASDALIGGPAPAASARPADGARPLSRDLLCPLAVKVPGSAPEAFADEPLACSCAASRERCRLVGIANDRRRGLVLPPGTSLTRVLARDGADDLRFAAAARGATGSAIDLRVAVADEHGGGSREWHRILRPRATWVDARLPLGDITGSRLRLTVTVTAPADAVATDAVVLATPRLVRTAAARHGEPRAPYNVLVYLVDTLRADHTTPYGSERATTPRLAALAREGVVFENAYTVAPWTRPATASLLTGLYPSTHATERVGSLSPAAVTLAERFRRAGWATWAFVANGHVFGEGVGLDQGFDRFVAVRGRRLDNHARSDEIVALLLPQLDASGDEPFLLYVHAVDPHSPYDPPPAFAGRFRDPAYAGTIEPADTRRRTLRARALDESDVRRVRDLYDEDVAYQDEQLGALLDALAARGLRERTIVVVLSDHGEELHDHGDWEHGMRLFEEQVRIPLVLAVPGLAGGAGRRVTEPAAIVDVLPTLLTLVGIPHREPVQGVDLRPALTRSASAQPTGAPRPGYFEEIRPGEDRDLFALRDGRWKIIREVMHASGERHDTLFDLETDPLERHDLAARDPAMLEVVRARLDAMPGLLAAQAAPLPAGAPFAPSDATRRQLEALGYVVPDGPKR